VSVAASHAQIARAAKDLLAAWTGAREAWRDENTDRFERQYIELLRAELRTAVLALESLNTILERVHHDCG